MRWNYLFDEENRDRMYTQLPSGLYVPADFQRYPTTFDLFAGCGGFSLGFVMAGFEVLGALDNDPSASHTYLTNLGAWPMEIHYTSDQYRQQLTQYFERYLQKKEREMQKKGVSRSYSYSEDKEHFEIIESTEILLPRELRAGSGWIESRRLAGEYYPPVKNFWFGDIREITGAEILDTLDMDRGEIDCVIGGPPCQGFSRMNVHTRKAKSYDPRNNLVFEFARLVVELQPKTFIMENLPELVHMVTPQGVPVIDQFCRIIADGDYMSYEAAMRAIRNMLEDGKQITYGVHAKRRDQEGQQGDSPEEPATAQLEMDF